MRGHWALTGAEPMEQWMDGWMDGWTDQGSAFQPFFNRGTLSWNRSPDGTQHLWHLFFIQDLHIMCNL